MTTRVYIDGFNLYYRAVKNTPYKWLNLRKMCELILPEYPIGKIKYFTANVSARKTDPDQPTRQQIYFRALKTIPDFEIIRGKFISRDRAMPLSKPIFGNGWLARFARKIILKLGLDDSFLDRHKIVLVIYTEEKGSDVNLATHLLIDGFGKEYDTAVVISNDSDLEAPIKYVRDVLKLPIILLNPDEKSTSKTLARAASSVRQIRKGALEASQFPEKMTDRSGWFHKPETWQ